MNAVSKFIEDLTTNARGHYFNAYLKHFEDIQPKVAVQRAQRLADKKVNELLDMVELTLKTQGGSSGAAS